MNNSVCGHVRRSGSALLFLGFLTLTTALAPSPVLASSYRDVPSSHWASNAVEGLRTLGVLPAKSTFGGTKPALRYDVFISTHRLLNSLNAYSRLRRSRMPQLDDIPPAGEPREAIISLASKGMVKGDGRNRINGRNRITRYETAAFFGRLAEQLGLSAPGSAPHFNDLPSNHWAAPHVRRLASLGILRGYGDSTFKGDAQVNRFELAMILSKFSGHLSGKTPVVADNKAPTAQKDESSRKRRTPGRRRTSSTPASGSTSGAAAVAGAAGTTGAAATTGAAGSSAGATTKPVAKNASLKKGESRLSRPANLDTKGLPKASFDKLITVIADTMTGGQAYEYGKWDCSKYVQYVMGQVGVTLPRTSADMSAKGLGAGLETLVPGDLVFFDFRKGVTKPSKATHVGIFLGARGRIQFAFTHNSVSAGKVVIANLTMPDFLSRLLTVRRVADFGRN